MQRTHLYNRLSKQSDEQIKKSLAEASIILIEELSIRNDALQRYIETCLPSIRIHICNAVEWNTLDKLFVSPRYPESNPKIPFSFGTKMDNKLYRRILSEINECRFLSDKIEMIKNNVHSLSDLEDLLFDAELSQSEMIAVLNLLDIIEVAALIKRHPYPSDMDAADASENEQILRLCLNKFISMQAPAYQEKISKAIHFMEIMD